MACKMQIGKAMFDGQIFLRLSHQNLEQLPLRSTIGFVSLIVYPSLRGLTSAATPV
jgi:hypothetical protein